ncbi:MULTISPECIES: amidohydrolase [Rhodopseudomonas]|uniref:Amidohydrolase n=1 Tax=Rhodopseudomonas palustris TaxID=1076 RepID=A0A0D7ER47_RHOPL|nr:MULTISPECIES: amidohydrolase [Rhodopseudomonas]KIZ41927.1 amidohydrolase [Rhodopseudomonas palustris]MDF3814084.1 amidohydrolase family protein [Rhodopseudomonas sp. BAL398]WOK15769.1 amidohydrolase family protein [Rhodopseudomonas sp. BAL398]
MSHDTVVFSARNIITMNPSRPSATHVAVRDGRVVATGSADELCASGARLDDRFKDKVLMPGFVEGHSHIMEGLMWLLPYVGAFDRRSPEGRTVSGAPDIDAIVARLQEAEAKLPDDGTILYAWGFDPLHIGGKMLSRHDLDRVSTKRPVVVVHASFHINNVNTLTLERAELLQATNISGVVAGADGLASGELQGIPARMRLFRALGHNLQAGGTTRADVDRYAASCCVQGVTTITDLHNDLNDQTIEVYREAAQDADFGVRLVPALASASHPPEQAIAKLDTLRAHAGDKLHYGIVKLVVDGSIQGFTARLRWPGYHNGAANGLWYIAPEELPKLVLAYHRAGVQLHIHTNGDEATELALDAIEAAQLAHPRPDHRHTLQHCQMADAAQFKRMKTLGVCVNLFANHLYYWGDAHYELTMGPERAARLDATGTAQRLGVPFAIHSDAPVTPLAPLFTAWCAVNRTSSSGRVLGRDTEALTVAQALGALTIGAAFTLKLDHLVGSIETGKFADFVVLEDDPLTVAPELLKDIAIWGTVVGGVIKEAPRA